MNDAHCDEPPESKGNEVPYTGCRIERHADDERFHGTPAIDLPAEHDTGHKSADNVGGIGQCRHGFRYAVRRGTVANELHHEQVEHEHVDEVHAHERDECLRPKFLCLGHPSLRFKITNVAILLANCSIEPEANLDSLSQLLPARILGVRFFPANNELN